MNTYLPSQVDPDRAIFTVTVAAQLAQMHPQTLRQYDRLGLVCPVRARGGRRLYSRNDVARLRLVQQLSQDEGINLAGIRRILALESERRRLQQQVDELAVEVARLKRTPDTRVFTAEVSGAVHLGRRAPVRRALPSR